ncbi:NNP family nitrate/nitrite transporter-like MFS transporter [Propioniferax innocua]|uniref:NNP family nitrate/nitrite transporter-like MFS transporter n=1 Tax=Propioniferax innocua TaxID=1753 RepID=A0A542ZRG0_9ACTN|nr:MFS transporter [Propioniferax innocua]TQL62938.1 NNP family nitrate/nitrite transporter-like MFS transporter [Propioniferax innocua]
MTETTDRKGKEWLTQWDPEGDGWDSRLAWTTLWITTFTLTMCFVAWFLPSAIAPKLTNLGFDLTKNQLYWLTSMPGLAGGILRLVWMVLPPILGTRKLVTLTTALLLIPMLGWGVAVQNPSTPYWQLLLLALMSGIGGGAFSGFMPSTSYFFPRRKQGTALGLQAGIGNFGVSLVQLLTPWLIGFAMVGFLGTSQLMGGEPGMPEREIWYQNAAFFYVPFTIVGVILAWTMLKSVPVTANIKQQFDIFKNVDTWLMTLLYIMTFGTFAGLSAQFGLLMKNLYGAGNPEIVSGAGAQAQLLVEGYQLPDPVNYVFLGALVGAGARVVFSPLTDRMGGAIWTLISGIGLIASILFTMTALSPDPAAGAEALQADFTRFLWGMLLIFLFSGIGNASTFKQMPMIFERRQAGGVIGWTAAIAAFGPFLFGVGLTMMTPWTFFLLGMIFAVLCVGITWVRYARPGAPRKS